MAAVYGTLLVSHWYERMAKDALIHVQLKYERLFLWI